MDKTSGQGGISDEEYTAEVRNFNPVNFDANAIAKPAKDTGMKYINIPSKHHDGFAMYDSKSNDFNFKSFCTHSPIHSRFVAFK